MHKNEYFNVIKQYPSAWLGHFEFAINLVQTFKPTTIVDLGVDYGFSTFSFAYSNIGNVYGIDWFQGDMHAGNRNTYPLVMDLYNEVKNKFNISNIEFIKSDFNEAAKKWSKKIDILHIDGLHTYEAVKNDFETWTKFCNNDSIILFHDVEEFPDVYKFFSELSDNKLLISGWCGLGVFTKSKTNFETIKNILI